MKTIFSVSIIGLGKLGAPFGATVASRGFKVIGVDVNVQTVAQINKSQPPVFEPKLTQLLQRYHRHLHATISVEKAIRQSQLTFVIIPTPSRANGSFTNTYLKKALTDIGRALRKKSGYHLVAIVSTIMPGSMEDELLPILEKTSGKKIGEKVGLCYNPSFIALGNVSANLLSPDVVLIGESDKKAGDSLENFYSHFCINHPPVRRMNFINAEIAKLALNTFITAKISYANMLAELCEKMPGADIDTVTNTIGLDSRVGKKYLTGAVAYGGPCFPRDNRALSFAGKKRGVQMTLAKATDEVNKRQTKAILELLFAQQKNLKTIGILGITYKPHTDVIEESQGMKLAEILLKTKRTVLGYDSAVHNIPASVSKKGFRLVKTIETLIARCDAIVITTPEKEMATVLTHALTKVRKRSILIIDCWRILNPKKLGRSVVYKARGRL